MGLVQSYILDPFYNAISFGQKMEKAKDPDPVFRTIVKKFQKSIETDIHEIIDLSKTKSIQTLSDDDDRIKNIRFFKGYFFESNLDSISKIPRSIQGNIRSFSLAFLIDQLEHYKAEMGEELDEDDQQEVDQALLCLQNAYQVAVNILVIRLLMESNKFESASITLKDLCTNLKKQITQLSVNQKLIIPGGVVEHNIVYELIRIEGEEEDSKPLFQFKVFNSGLGSYHHLEYLPSFLKRIAPWMKDRTYVVNDMTLDQIIGPLPGKKESLLQLLLSYAVGVNYKKSGIPLIGKWFDHFHTKSQISSIYQSIRATMTEKNTIDFGARKHKLQKQGSCSRKPYNHILQEDFLSKSNYRQFKVVSTQHSIDQLKNIQKILDSSSTLKISRFRRYLFHTCYLARLIFSFRNHISNQSLIYLGENVLKKRIKKNKNIELETI